MKTIKYNNKSYYIFENIEEFKKHLDKLKITRTINRLQVHHTALPNYDNWKTDNMERRLKGMVDFHKKTFNTNDMAQQYTIFPNGMIATGRDINSTPIGIKGWNTNAICCEIYGGFDSDKMNKDQEAAVIAFYGLWCKKLKLSPSENTIRYHAWLTASGTYLGDYVKGKSSKTCPGLKFFGGNTMKSFKSNFLPKVKEYINEKGSNETTNTVTKTEWKNGDYNAKVRATANLNLREGRGTGYKVIKTIPKGTVFEVGYVNNNWGSTWDFGKVGYFSCDYIEKV